MSGKIQLRNKGLAVLAAALLAPQAALAESGSATGTGASVNARVDFRVIIPTFLTFQVGSSGATVDEICFQPTATEVETGATVGADATCSATGSSGTLAVSVVSNGGQVTITEGNDGAGNGLTNGTDFLDYSTITTGSDNASLFAPVLSNAGTNSEPVTLSSGSVTNEIANWTYQFTSPGLPPAAGTYTGTVTYTAAIP